MKLPSGETKLSEGGEGGGHGEEGRNDENSSGESRHGEVNGDSSGGASGHNSTSDADFSDYLWMENEEEYNQQVMKELEEEEMIDYFYELYEDSLEAEAAGGDFPYESAFGAQNLVQSGGSSSDELSATLNRVLNFSTPLNPNAPEFVPGSSMRVQTDGQEATGTSS